jgi:predicted DNA-binding transcriptional regulator AlpA
MAPLRRHYRAVWRMMRLMRIARKGRDAIVESIEANDLNDASDQLTGGARVSDTVVGQGADLISVGDVAEILSVSKSTAARIADKEPGFPKPFRLNAKTSKYSKTAVLAWLQSKQEP